ncbi:MAG: hypothetical protein WDM81_02005 [Rhizomicrobium sp.]
MDGASNSLKSGRSDLPKAMHVDKASKKLSICVVYGRLPFPMMRGDQLTVAHILAFLAARGHETDFFTLGLDGELSDIQADWLRGSCRELHIYDQSWLSKFTGILSGLVRGVPLQVGMFDNRNLLRDVRAAIEAGKYDLIYVYYLRSAEVIPKGFGQAVETKKNGRRVAAFLAMQLSQALNTRRIFKNEQNVLRKLLFFFEWQLIRLYEARIWNKFTRSVLIGPATLLRSKRSAVCFACRRSTIGSTEPTEPT